MVPMPDLRVCLIDEDPSIRRLLSHVVDEASQPCSIRDCNIADAAAMVSSFAPDVLFLDMRADATRRMWNLSREQQHEARALVLMTDDDRDGLRAFTAGAVDCLKKPL